MTTPWQHDNLAADLAGHLYAPDRMVWRDMQLGSHGSPRPDVYAIDKSYSKPNPTAYECKISVADFRADVTTGKWASYLRFAHRIVFAAPAGLISKSDVPEHCGLIVRHENSWRYAKRATVNPRPIDQEALLKLLIDGVHREGPRDRARRWSGTDGFSKRFGAEAARYVADAAQIHERLQQAEEQRKQIIERANMDAFTIIGRATVAAPGLWGDLLAALNLPANSTTRQVKQAIAACQNARSGTAEVQALRQVLDGMRRLVSQHEHLATPAVTP